MESLCHTAILKKFEILCPSSEKSEKIKFCLELNQKQKVCLHQASMFCLPNANVDKNSVDWSWFLQTSKSSLILLQICFKASAIHFVWNLVPVFIGKLPLGCPLTPQDGRWCWILSATKITEHNLLLWNVVTSKSRTRTLVAQYLWSIIIGIGVEPSGCTICVFLSTDGGSANRSES